MRILVLSKRRYMGKDLLADRYGRYFEIPEELVSLGHEVKGVALAYTGGHSTYTDPSSANWSSVSLFPFPPVKFIRYLMLLRSHIESFRPEVIWTGSDAFHGVIGATLGRLHRIPHVVDLYDNYEAYGLTRLPGLKALFIRSCQRAIALTVVGSRLKHFVSTNYRKNAESIHVLGNAIRDDLFTKYDKKIARKKLGLPEHGLILGTAGALTADRGIELLYEAFISLARSRDDVFLVVAGQRDHAIEKYKHSRIIDLGMLPLATIPLVYNALDVAVICNKRSSFGEYCFPQKFYEIIACGTPLVAANVGEMGDLLKSHKDLLFDVDSVSSLKEAVLRQLDHPKLVWDMEVPTWSTRAQALERIFESITCVPSYADAEAK